MKNGKYTLKIIFTLYIVRKSPIREGKIKPMDLDTIHRNILYERVNKMKDNVILLILFNSLVRV